MKYSGRTSDASGSLTAGTDKLALPKTIERDALIVVNLHATETMWLNFGREASAGLGSIPIPPMSGQEFRFGHTDDVHLFCAADADYTLKHA